MTPPHLFGGGAAVGNRKRPSTPTLAGVLSRTPSPLAGGLGVMFFGLLSSLSYMQMPPQSFAHLLANPATS